MARDHRRLAAIVSLDVAGYSRLMGVDDSGTLAALAASIYIPLIGDLFRFAPLAAGQVALAAGAGVAGVLWYEAYKALRPRIARG